ncbi:MAG: hypothetical protein JWO51_2473 [Rhodospirillales bacterium]|jgi:hypothetical protein|nr:hypothetical protein [Rhodospirillales bacterium]
MAILHSLYHTSDDAESTYRGLVELGVPMEDIKLLRYEAIETKPSPAAPDLIDQMGLEGLSVADARQYTDGLLRGDILLRVTVDPATATGAAALLSKYHPVFYDRLPTPKI